MQDQERPQDDEYAGDPAESPSDTVDVEALLEAAFAAEDESTEGGNTLDSDDAGEDDADYDAEIADDDDDSEDEPESEPDPKANDKPKRPQPTQDELIRYGTLVAQNPANISQVPRRLQEQVVRSVIAAAYQRATLDAAKEWQTRSSQEELIRNFVAERDQMRTGNPESFMEWEDSNPEEAERYHAARRQLAAQRNQPDPAPVTSPEEIQNRATEQFTRLETLPEEVRNKVVGRVQNGEFSQTEEGLQRLRATVDAAYVEAMTAAREPVRRRADARSTAAKQRNTLARPIVTPGDAHADENQIRDINDPEELFALAFKSQG